VRWKFTLEFKAEAVDLLVSSGKAIAAIAQKLGISDRTLGELDECGEETRRFQIKALEIDERARLKVLKEKTAV
jgi:transposase